ncbi:MAG: 23S rRNA (adenine(2503)-C(2))-methyltransferase RlmN [bacterium]
MKRPTAARRPADNSPDAGRSSPQISASKAQRDKSESAPASLRSMYLIEITSQLQRAGFPAYRGKQVYHWIFKQGIRALDEMSNIPKDVRAFLAEKFRLGGVEMEKCQEAPSDGTKKMLFRLNDGRFIESVLMFDKGRNSLCVSTQVGCPLACSFCMTGLAGFQRNLGADEIVDQVLFAKRTFLPDRPLNNIIFMGMGEPLLNFDNTIRALRLLLDPQGVGMSSRRITVSTAGLIPGIDALGESDVDVNLAISLTATTDELRDRLIPLNRKYPIGDLIAAARRYPLTNRRRITFEYTLLKDFNDSDADARRLGKLLHGIRSKINLIQFNSGPGLPYELSAPQRVEAFRKVLTDKHLTVSLRYSKGSEIAAACGQLAGPLSQDRRNSPGKLKGIDTEPPNGF